MFRRGYVVALQLPPSEVQQRCHTLCNFVNFGTFSKGLVHLMVFAVLSYNIISILSVIFLSLHKCNDLRYNIKQIVLIYVIKYLNVYYKVLKFLFNFVIKSSPAYLINNLKKIKLLNCNYFSLIL